MKEIPLTRGKVAVVDDESYVRLSQFSWHVSPSGHKKNYWYAYRNCDGRLISMHRDVMKAQKGQMVDHINRDTLDNRKENLRFTTKSLNNANSKMRRRNESQLYKGIGRDQRFEGKQWFAAVYIDKKKIYSGKYFYTPEEAARAYDILAAKYFGEFACLNFPTDEATK